MEATPHHTLDLLQAGATVSVVRVEGQDVISKRLRDMGFWPGTSIRVGSRSPFGDPVAYHLRGYRLALRRAEAARVVVTLDQE